MDMRFASGIGDSLSVRQAVENACQQALLPLNGDSCDFACVFVSAVYRADWAEIAELIRQRLKPGVLIGCSASGVIGGGKELEWVPAVSVVAAHLPDVRLYPFSVLPDESEESSAGGFWIDKIGVSPDALPVFVLLADPYTCDPHKLITEINATYRMQPIVGGLVSGGNEPGEHFLFVNDQVHTEGAVGLAMTGNIAMDTVISQGCRPIGRPYVVTKADENEVMELGGRVALSVLHEVLASLPANDRELAQRGSVFVGLAATEMRQTFRAGDFLVRNIVGLDPDTGSLAVAERVAIGQTLQFQLRDPTTSRQELRRLLQKNQTPDLAPPSGCLLFTCTGRGKSLYGISHQDVKMIQTVNGKVPVGGFFCNGEIGPIAGKNFLHGYTASVGLFRPQLRVEPCATQGPEPSAPQLGPQP